MILGLLVLGILGIASKSIELAQICVEAAINRALTPLGAPRRALRPSSAKFEPILAAPRLGVP